MSSGRRPRAGLVLPTLLATLASGVAVLVTVLAAGVALRPDAPPRPPGLAEVRPPVPLDAPAHPPQVSQGLHPGP
jgi:hypothetical protein